MPYFAVDDAFHAHPKALALRAGSYEAEALALWTKAGSWCAAGLTDGHVPRYVAEGLIKKNALRAAAELVRVNLWHETPEGWVFHQWHDHQQSADEVKRKRADAKERMRELRRNKDGKFDARSKTVRANNARTFAERSAAPSHPIPEESANALSVAREVPRHIARFEAQFAKPQPSTSDSLGIADVEALFSELRKSAGGAAYKNRNHRDDTHLAAVADDANEAAASRQGRVEALTASIRGFLADAKAREAGCPIGWLATDPGRYRATALMAQPKASDIPTLTLSPLESAFIHAQKAAQEAVQRGADAQTQFDLDQAEEAARRALAASRRAS